MINYRPEHEEEESSTKQVFQSANFVRKWITKLQSFAGSLSAIINAVLALLIIDTVIQTAQEGNKAIDQATDKQGQTANQTAADGETSEDKQSSEAGETLADIAAGLSASDAAAAKVIGKSFSAGNIDITAALASLSEINASASLRAVNAGLTSISSETLNAAVGEDTAQDEPLVIEPINQGSALPIPAASPPQQAPEITSEVSFSGDTYTVDINITDDDGDLFTQSQLRFEYAIQDLINGGIPDIEITAIDKAGNETTQIHDVPTLLDTPGNDAPVPVPQTRIIDENQEAVLIAKAWDTEDGILVETIDIGQYDFETDGPLVTETVRFTDSEGLFVDGDIDIIINDLLDHKVSTGFSFVSEIDITLVLGMGFSNQIDLIPDQDAFIQWFQAPATTNTFQFAITDNLGNVLIAPSTSEGNYTYDASAHNEIDFLTITAHLDGTSAFALPIQIDSYTENFYLT